MILQIIIPILTAGLGTVLGSTSTIFINRKFPNITYKQKLFNILKQKNKINFNDYEIEKLKDLLFKKIEDYLNEEEFFGKNDFKELKNIIFSVVTYLRFGESSYKKIKNISFNFSNNENSIINSGDCYNFDFHYMTFRKKNEKKVYKKDAISKLKYSLQPQFSFNHYQDLNSTTYDESWGMDFDLHTIPINFEKNKKNPFLTFLNEKKENEKKYHYLEEEYIKIKKEIQEKCQNLNIPFSIYTSCKEHKKDLWTVIFTWEYTKGDSIFYIYFNNYHQDIEVLLEKTILQSEKIDLELKNINNYYLRYISMKKGIHSYNLSDSQHIWNYLDIKKDNSWKNSKDSAILWHLEKNIITTEGNINNG